LHLGTAVFSLTQAIERGLYEGVGHPSQRAYLLVC